MVFGFFLYLGAFALKAKREVTARGAVSQELAVI